MTKPNTENDLFEFAASRRAGRTADEQLLRELYGALGMQSPPTSLLQPSASTSSGKDNEMNAIAMQPVPPAPAWQPSRWLTIAAAMAIVLSMIGYGIWNIGGSQTPETPLAPYNPGLAMQSPVAEEGCFDNGQALLLYANVFPIDATTLIITDTNELKFRCAGSDHAVVVDTDILAVTPTKVPGTIEVIRAADGEPKDAQSIAYEAYLLNLPTGKRLELAGISETAQTRQAETGPWYVTRTAAAPGTLSVIDLRTLKTYAMIPERENDESAWTVATSSADGSVTAIAILDSFRIDRDPAHQGVSDMLVLGDTFESGFWVPLDESDGIISGMLMSPDGAYVALEILGGTSMVGTPTVSQITIIETTTGDIVVKGAGQDVFAITFPGWTTDSTRFIYSSGTMIGILAPTNINSTTSGLEAEGVITHLIFTPDPAIMLVEVSTPLQETISSTYRVSLDDGSWERLGQSDSLLGFPTDRLESPLIVVEDGLSYSWQDSVTGEVISRYSYESLAAATPVSEPAEPTVSILIEPPLFAGIDTDDMKLVFWGADLQLKVLQAPAEPTEAYTYSGEVSADGRYIILNDYPYWLWDGVTSPTPSDGPPKSLYILDTEAPEPVWIPIE